MTNYELAQEFRRWLDNGKCSVWYRDQNDDTLRSK